MTEKSLQYLVLARKYRPKILSDLIGQEALVQILSNGIAQNRLPHAFILTGIRGTGKTTTARIIARALNCVGIDGTGEPTSSPCGLCEHCKAIAEDRHIDVTEMDAASRTGVDDIREVIEATRYRSVSARYKIYIIDEVHMLSKNAFNALLKTLEEPPPHVKFIFATTEIRKIPDTILSRCMRFDLRRVDQKVLQNYFKKITELEGKQIEEEATHLIAKAADGSVRDGLSILDQAITLSDKVVTVNRIREMLGLTDQNQILEIVEAIVHGESQVSLKLFQALCRKGTDPVAVLKDILGFIHTLSLQHSDIPSPSNYGLTAEQIDRSLKLAKDLSLPLLSRLWQSLIKGIQDVNVAPLPEQAVEMVLLRLCYLSHLPTPKEVVEHLITAPQEITSKILKQDLLPSQNQVNKNSTLIEPNHSVPRDFKELVALCQKYREPLLEATLKNDVHLVDFKLGAITLYLTAQAPKDLSQRLKLSLKEWTGIEWQIIINDKPENLNPSLQTQYENERIQIRNALLKEPLVKAAQETFPDSEIVFIDDIPKENLQ